MTQEQQNALHNYVMQNKSKTDFNGLYLENKEIIKFTGVDEYYNNSQFQLNNHPQHFIWFSQLAQFFYTSDMTTLVATIAIDGRERDICDYDNCSFWKVVKDKSFKVIKSGPYYVINKKSTRARELGFESFKEAEDYIKQCIAKNEYNAIGDLLKLACCYDLVFIAEI